MSELCYMLPHYYLLQKFNDFDECPDQTATVKTMQPFLQAYKIG